MTADRYTVFLRVLDEGSLTHAAEHLGMTQSGVTQSLNALEKELGLKLLRRSRTGIALTPEGQLLLSDIRAVVETGERLRRRAETLRPLDGGTVRVGAFTSVAVHWLPGILKEFQADHPRAEIRMLNGDYGDVQEWLDSGKLDVGFVPLPVSGGWHTVPLWRDPLLAVLPKTHPLAQRERYPLREIEKESFISLAEGSDQDARRAMESAGVRPSVKFSTKDDYAIIAMVAGGLGVSILPGLLLEGRAEDVRVMELDPPASRVIGMVIRTGASPMVNAFAEHVSRWVEKIRPASAAPGNYR